MTVEIPVSPAPEGRSAIAIGIDWGTRITTIGLEFGLPALLGFGLDRWWKTLPWMTILGVFLGLAMGMTHLVRMAAELTAAGRKKQ